MHQCKTHYLSNQKEFASLTSEVDGHVDYQTTVSIIRARYELQSDPSPHWTIALEYGRHTELLEASVGPLHLTTLDYWT